MLLAKKPKKEVLERFAEALKEVDKDKVSLVVWLLGTVVCHKLNLAGFINWMGQPTDKIDTGLPGPFKWRMRFPWEKADKPDLTDKITEWGIPALTSWMLVYHPEAVAAFVDALIPF